MLIQSASQEDMKMIRTKGSFCTSTLPFPRTMTDYVFSVYTGTGGQEDSFAVNFFLEIPSTDTCL